MEGGITAALLFADIEGSTRLLTRLGDGYADLLGDYRRLLAEAVHLGDGEIVDTEGDGLFAVLPTAGAAVAAAVAAQRSLAGHAWPAGEDVRARLGLHVGSLRRAGNGYVGLDVHVAARVAAAAHGGQVLVTAAVAQLSGGTLPDGVALRNLGEHRLKDIEVPERLYQLDIEGLQSDFPPPRGVAGRRHNLPAILSSFVGRDTEAVQVAELLDEHRLVTLTGVGGAGKTRLAVDVAASRVDAYRDGVWMVDLSALGDAAQVPAEVGRAVGISEPRAGDLLAQLLIRLSDTELLLVMDNCEQLLPDVAVTIGEIVRSAPGVSVLATSRAALDVRGEVIYWVPSLGLPGPAASAVEARRAPAVELFIERAAAARRARQVDNEEVLAIAEICRRLDGIPLALELAAARTRVLSPQRLLDRLDDAFTVLGAAGEATPSRHRTLAATLDWSHGLLAAEERVLLRRLGVFAGSFTLEAAEAVCVGEGLEAGVLIDALDHLVASSVVTPADWVDGRYGMLRTVRSYARRRLEESGEAAATSLAHADHFRKLVRGGGQDLGRREQAAWLATLEDDHDNFRTVLRLLIDNGDAAGAADLAGSLCRFWYQRGYFVEARRWIDEVLAMDGLEPSPGLATVLRFAAATAISAGEGDRAKEMADRSTAAARGLGDDALLARSLNVQAGILWRLGELREALDRYEAALALLPRSDPFAARLLANKADMLVDMGRLVDVEAILEQVREQGAREQHVDLRPVEGSLLFARGDLDGAEAILTEAVQTYRDLGLLANLAGALRTRAEIVRAAGRFEEAFADAREAMELFAEDDPSNHAWTEISFAGITADLGGVEEARETLARCVAVLDAAGWRLAVLEGLVEVARLAAGEGNWRRWARLAGAAGALADELGAAPAPGAARALAEHEAAATAALGAAEVRRERAAGAVTPLEEIVATIAGST